MALISFAPYFQTKSFDFINYDDWTYVVKKFDTFKGFNYSAIRWDPTNTGNRGGIWFPLTQFSYITDVSLFGENPGAMHLINAFFHSIGAVLFFLFLFNISKSFPGAFLGALFWALHPLRAEAVSWIACRKDMLVFPLIMAGLLCHAKVFEPDVGIRKQHFFSCLCFFFFFLALAAKPTAIVFPFLMLVTEGLVSGKIRGKNFLPATFITLFGVFATVQAQKDGGALEGLANVPLYQKLINAMATVGVYIRETVAPCGLYIPHIFEWPVPLSDVVLGAVIILGFVCVLLRAHCRPERSEDGKYTVRVPQNTAESLVILSFLWFFAAVSPVIGIVGFGAHAHSDRFTYLPAAGFSIAIAVLIAKLCCENKKRARYVVAVFGGILCLLSVATIRQASFWKNDSMLFSRTLKFDPDNTLANQNMGTYEFSVNGDGAASLRYYKRVLECVDDPTCRMQCVFVAAEMGDIATIQECSEFARNLPFDCPEYAGFLSYCLGLEAYCAGNMNAAKGIFETALKSGMRHVSICYPLAKVYESIGEMDKSAFMYSQIRRDPLFRRFQMPDFVDVCSPVKCNTLDNNYFQQMNPF